MCAGSCACAVAARLHLSGINVHAGRQAAPELQPVNVGDVLPSYMLKNEKGEDVDVASLATEKGVVFFLVPKADTRAHFSRG